MTVHPKLKPVFYGLSVFVIFIILTFVLRTLTHRVPANPDFWGVFTLNDVLLGLLVAFVLTFSHERKKKFKP